MGKHVTVLLATLLAFGVSTYFLRQVIGLASPWMGLLLMLCFLGLARIAEPLYRLKMPDGLRQIRPWELNGGLYRTLRVHEFGALLRDTPLRLLNSSVYVSRNRRDPLSTCRQVEAAEASHLWAALVLVPYLVFCTWSAAWASAGGLVLVEILGNAYPIMHLRSVRGRLERVSLRAQARGLPRANLVPSESQ
jgi:hypothetical protein